MKNAIKADFIGTDGSMGLHKGDTYKLITNPNIEDGYLWIIVMTPLVFMPNIKIPYSNLYTFSKNWRIL